jgi:hypothetical protein
VGNSSIPVTPPSDGSVSSKGTGNQGSFAVDDKGEQVTKPGIGTVSEVPVLGESTTVSSNTSEAAGNETTSGQ